jgi:GNAT superfamily N-acetyltransferase
VRFQVYRLRCGEDAPPARPGTGGRDWILWRPSLLRFVPPGLPLVPYGAWWLFHYAGIFGNPDYRILLLYDKGVPLHRSVVTPPFFRFPFLGREDLQIGDTWTAPESRGRGIAAAALRQVVDRLGRPGRTFWYVVEEENGASIAAVRKAGFERHGTAVRTSRLGLRLLGAYELTEGKNGG